MNGGPDSGSPPTLPRRSVFRRPLVGFLAAVVLLSAAAVALATHADQFQRALDAASRAPWWLPALALALPILNWLLMSTSFWVLMRRHGSIGLGEMSCLIGAAWLMNYLPLRPGLFGRIAYHKAVNGIPVSKSIAVTITSVATAGIAIGILLAAAGLNAAAHQSGAMSLLIIAAAPLTMGLLGTLAVLMLHGPWWLALTVVFRYADLLVWTARYTVVFAIIGQPLTLGGAAAIAAIVQVAMLIPLAGNGLGLREWAVGATTGAVPPGVLSLTGTLTTATGLAADLVNRAAEVACALPVGIGCAAWIARRVPRVAPVASDTVD